MATATTWSEELDVILLDPPYGEVYAAQAIHRGGPRRSTTNKTGCNAALAVVERDCLSAARTDGGRSRTGTGSGGIAAYLCGAQSHQARQTHRADNELHGGRSREPPSWSNGWRAWCMRMSSTWTRCAGSQSRRMNWRTLEAFRAARRSFAGWWPRPNQRSSPSRVGIRR